MTEKRFIEEYFPVKEVSVESSKEKNHTHGHISTLHRWWARRPLAASRTTIYASLIPIPKTSKEIASCKRTIIDLSKWENSTNFNMIELAREHIMKHCKTPPKILDPFGGGGSIPLESLRLGCETYATDYNPVANLIIRATTEYPFLQKNHDANWIKSSIDSPLITNVKKWSQYVLKEAKKELSRFFPDKDGEEPIGYIWARCIPCQNPRCSATVPLIKQFWLAKRDRRNTTLVPYVEGKHVKFSIIDIDKEKLPKGIDPSKGTVSRGKATCLVCGHRMDGAVVKSLFVQKKNSERMNLIITKKATSGKNYRIVEQDDLDVYKKAQNLLKKKRIKFKEKYNVDPIPNEPTPNGKGSGAERAFSVRLYNMNTWGELFNDRQKLVLLTFTEKILEAITKIEKDSSKNAMQIIPYLGIIFGRLAEKNATLCRWHAQVENIEGVFGRQALPIIWDYPELNPFTSVGWPSMENLVMKVLEHLSNINNGMPAIIKHTSATKLPFQDMYFDAVLTDPPYYDNVPYSHLSDFFYVWLKRTLGSKFPDLFSTPLTPKRDEIVAYSNVPDGYESGKEFFEDMLKKSFSEIYRVLKSDGIFVVVYAHKSTDGWETLIHSLLKAGFTITAAWPIHTEMKTRLRSRRSAALLSSIYMVCRKLEKKPIGFYSDMRRELENYLTKKLDQFWSEHIYGADLFIASIGSAIEVYGKYKRVIDNKDQDVSVLQLLEDTRTIVTNYAINKVTRGEFADRISKMTRFYILWRWAHGEAKVPFDEAKKLAQSVGIDLAEKWGSGFIKKDNEYIRVLGPDERSYDDLDGSDELVDILHYALKLWREQKIDKAHDLVERGYGHSEVLRRVADAISSTLSDSGSEEKIWIDGMFTGGLTPLDKSQTKII